MGRPETPYGMPLRIFLYTLDQISMMLAMEERHLKKVIFYDARSVGPVPKDMMLARNIAAATEKPEWRVSETEFKRWLRYKGYRVYDRASTGR